MKKIAGSFSSTLAVILTLLLALSFAACDLLDDGKELLSVPENVRIDASDLKLKWDPVLLSNGYTVDIGGVTANITGTTEYDLSSYIAEQKVFTVKVKATAGVGSAVYSDSAYSTPLNCEPAVYIFEYDDGALAPSLQYARSIASGLTITGLTAFGQALTTIIIPEAIGSVTVTVIGDSAFEDASVVTVEIPNTIVEIGSSAFSGTAIVSVVIPASVVSIGDGAFSDCAALTDVTFTRSTSDGGVTSLGEGVFDGSDAITAIVVPADSADAYETAIEESAPSLADKITSKALAAIEVTKLPETTYQAGTWFSINYMTVTAIYSDGTTATIKDGYYSIYLSGGEEMRALTVNDKVVIVSYTEDGITRTTEISITVTSNNSGTTNPGDNGGGTNPNQQTYTVVFNANGGYFTGSGSSTGTTDKISVQVQAGQTVTAPAVYHSNNNLTFTGWYELTSTGGTTNNNAFNFNTPINGYLELYAQWNSGSSTGDGGNGSGTQPTYYTVVFNANGGYFTGSGSSTGTTDKISVQVQAGQTVTAPSNPTNNGFTFTGWYELTSTGGTTNNNAFNFNTPINGYLELYAQWSSGSGTGDGGNGSGTQPTYYTVVFNANGGYFTESGSSTGTTDKISVQVQAGQTVTAPANPTNNGFTFTGWYALTDSGNYNNNTFDFNTRINGYLELYAQWSSGSSTGDGGNGSGTQPTYYTVVFNANGGYFIESGSTGTTDKIAVQVQAGQTVTAQAVYHSDNNLTFTGWYELTSTGGTTNNNTFNFNTPINGYVELNAQWSSSTGDGGNNGNSTGSGDNGSGSGATGDGDKQP